MGPTDRFTVDHAVDLYGLDRWGNGYLAVGADGHLRVQPVADRLRFIDVVDVVQRLARRGLTPPVLLRFPQLLAAQVERLAGAFGSAIDEYHYPGRYHPVFPMKVNQQRTVVEGLLQAGWKHGLGLEAGSVPELLACSVLPVPADAVMICNGFKDRRYLAAASLAARLGKQVVVVIEKPFELGPIIEMAREAEFEPSLGIRMRLAARGTGLWEKSSGATSKFGLTTAELLAALDQLDAAGLSDKLTLLHFHLGSQVTEIRRLKTAVREATRVYAKLVKKGVALRYLDVGGGLGVDYDGSRTSSDASMNYTVQEYANDVVYGIQEVCEEEGVMPPQILSESGRMLTAYHAILVADARTSTTAGAEIAPPPAAEDDPQVLLDLGHVAAEITVKNYREYYHDALEYRDQLNSLFNLGLIDLEVRAHGENLFWAIVRKTVRFSRSAKFVAEEFVALEKTLHEKYICNFSVFQSLPDHWALDQVFPVVPVHRLDERPSRRAMLVDISCDSLGTVDRFADLKEVKEAVEVHALRPDEPYWLGFLLIGAYQDAIGDMHNLLGSVHEADVVLDSFGETLIRDVRHGQSAKDTLEAFGYTDALLDERLLSALAERVKTGALTPEAADELHSLYRSRLATYTYLES
ncbi:MAG: biosynthetic arginine decarboxylase [Acidobacteriota bacterium]